MSQRPQVFQNIGRRHDICLKVKIFAERYPFFFNEYQPLTWK